MAPKAINRYQNYLSRRTTPFRCPDCDESLLPRRYEHHCFLHHATDPKITCVWCRTFSWPPQHKQRFGDHLLECARKFLARKAAEAAAAAVLLLPDFDGPLRRFLVDLRPLDPARHFFGIENHLATQAHHPLALVDVDTASYPPLYAHDTLHLASQYVRYYLDRAPHADWFHIMVRSVAYDRFVEAMLQEPDACRTLAFSCWCNGGTQTVGEYRQHRHLIVVSSPPGHFDSAVWAKVRPDRQPSPNFQCKRLQRIESALHLVHTMAYLSRRRSKCQFSFDTPDSNLPHSNNHFYLYTTLPRGYGMPLAALWEGGLPSWINHIFRKTAVMHIADRPLQLREGQWQQQLKHHHALPRGIVLPVRPDLVPTPDETTPLFVYLGWGRKLHFRRDPALAELAPDDWLSAQVYAKNCFFDVVQEEWWTPGPSLQKELNNLMPLKDRIRELETEMATLRERRNEEPAAELRQQYARLEEALADVRRAYAELHERYARSERELADVRDRYARSERELADVRQELAAVRLAYVQLQVRYGRLEQAVDPL